jgi:hypothetical protein
VRLLLEELELHDSARVEHGVTDLVEADPRLVGKGDLGAEGEGRLALPERLSLLLVG